MMCTASFNENDRATLVSNSEQIRIGLLVEGYYAPAWMYQAIALVRQSSHSAIGLVVIDERSSATSSASDALLYGAYCWFDRRIHSVEDDACATSDLSQLLGDLPTVRMKEEEEWGRVAEKISKARIDILVWLGSHRPIGVEFSEVVREVWAYPYTDVADRSGFQEVINGAPVTDSVLESVQPGTEARTVLAYSYTATDKWSYVRNRSRMLWKASALLERALRDLHAARKESRVRTHIEKTLAQCSVQDPLTSRKLLPRLVRHSLNYVHKKVRVRTYRERWQVMYHIGDELTMDIVQFAMAESPPGATWADPFVLRRDGRFFVFIEEIPEGRKRGHIAVFDIDSEGQCSPARTIIEQPYHLSYPFVFEWQDELYLIPESGHNQTIDVYRCKDFPAEWEYCTTLMRDAWAADTTLVEYDGRWWLFTNMKAYKHTCTWDELHLFWADHPLSQHWIPHPQNPIVSDVRRARPAGKLFWKNGRLYRPSQDCSRGYGYGIRLNRVLTLNPTAYQEEEVYYLEPPRSLDVAGVHTINHVRGLTIVDANIRTSVLKTLIQRGLK